MEECSGPAPSRLWGSSTTSTRPHCIAQFAIVRKHFTSSHQHTSSEPNKLIWLLTLPGRDVCVKDDLGPVENVSGLYNNRSWSVYLPFFSCSGCQLTCASQMGSNFGDSQLMPNSNFVGNRLIIPKDAKWNEGDSPLEPRIHLVNLRIIPIVNGIYWIEKGIELRTIC